MKPFNLEEALDGKPVVTRSGDPVTQIVKFDLKNNIPYSIAGIHNGHICTWSYEGIFNISTDTQHQMDLFMAEVEKVQWVNFWENKYGVIITTSWNREDQADLEIEEELTHKHLKKIRITL
jgi:hypothetical protein